MKNGRVVDKDCPEALQKKIAGKVFEIRIVQEELNQVKKNLKSVTYSEQRGKLSCVSSRKSVQQHIAGQKSVQRWKMSIYMNLNVHPKRIKKE